MSIKAQHLVQAALNNNLPKAARLHQRRQWGVSYERRRRCHLTHVFLQLCHLVHAKGRICKTAAEETKQIKHRSQRGIQEAKSLPVNKTVPVQPRKCSKLQVTVTAPVALALVRATLHVSEKCHAKQTQRIIKCTVTFFNWSSALLLGKKSSIVRSTKLYVLLEWAVKEEIWSSGERTRCTTCP